MLSEYVPKKRVGVCNYNAYNSKSVSQRKQQKNDAGKIILFCAKNAIMDNSKDRSHTE